MHIATLVMVLQGAPGQKIDGRDRDGPGEIARDKNQTTDSQSVKWGQKIREEIKLDISFSILLYRT